LTIVVVDLTDGRVAEIKGQFLTQTELDLPVEKYSYNEMLFAMIE